MPASLLATKFYYPPLRENLIVRPRLEKKLSAGLARRLTLVSAPPGFGKTSLVAAWMQGLQPALDCPPSHAPAASAAAPLAAWLHLDEGDNDLVRFFTYLVAALQRLEPGLGQTILAQLEAEQLPPADALVIILINDLFALARNTLLVLDDYHLIHSEHIHHAILTLVERRPPNLHLILVTREDPPLPLARLRAQDEVAEVRERDLRFSVEEAAAFLTRTMGLRLTQEAIATLTRRTEGWIAGLQIAALSLQHGGDAEAVVAAFGGDDRLLIDYLMEEVVGRQPPHIQQFLLQTSVLNRLCAPLCDELLQDEETLPPAPAPGERPSSEEILDTLERSNLFIIPLDNKREWYRYHQLFADLLRYRLQRRFPEQAPLLHRRACHWYRLHGDVEEAMRHALAIPDHSLAADLAEGYLQQLIRDSRIAAGLNWIGQLPAEVVWSRAYLCANCAWVHMLNGDFAAAGSYLEAGVAALAGYEPVYSAAEQRRVTAQEVRGHLLAIRAYGARLQGDFAQTIALSEEALQRLPAASEIRSVIALNLGIVYTAIWEPELAWKTQLEALEMARGSRENLYVTVTALCQLAGLAVWQGKLREAERLCRQAIQLGTVQARRPIWIPAVAYAHGWLVAVHNQRNEPEAALSHIRQAIALVELVGPLATHIYARLFQARLALDSGDFAAAEAFLEWAEAQSRAYPIAGPVKTEWVVNRGRLFLERGDVPAAARWLRSQNVRAGDLLEAPPLADEALRPLRTRLPEYVLLARVLLAQGEQAPAEALLERICAAAEAWQFQEARLEALALLASGAVDAARALHYLEPALAMAASEGYVRPFLIAGERLLPLLRQAIVQDRHAAYAHRLPRELSAYPRTAALRTSPATGAGSALGELTEPLTERESQVLRLLAAGLSSTEIAGTLFLSVHTVRSYVKTLYRKLDVHSRDEAAAKGMQLGLL